jgi:hypothetical protein
MITIDKLQIPVTFTVTRNKGLVNEVATEVSTTLDFSEYTADDFMNRAIDSVVIAIQNTLRNPPKDASKQLAFSTLEGKTYKAPKPGRSVSRKAPADQMFEMYKKCSLQQRATLPKELQVYYEALIDAENEAEKQRKAEELAKLEAGEV